MSRKSSINTNSVSTAFSLGSNRGDRLGFLSRARQQLLACDGTTLVASSSVYETEPVGVQEAYRDLPFLNAVVVVDSPADAETWLQRLGEIEASLGRVRSEDRYAPRTIDIDLLFRGEDFIDSGGLVVPHPRWAQRRFVVEPLAEVCPDLVLPGQNQTVADILRALPPGEEVTRLDTVW